jgi:5-methylcytosine-specific restriction endonuclease McrA
LVARQDGGKDTAENIVAACWFCNSRRHRRTSAMAPEAFKKLVSKRKKLHKWHPQQFHHMLETI